MNDDLDVPNCPVDLHQMEAVGDVREIASDAERLVDGTAYWRCPVCGLVRLS